MKPKKSIINEFFVLFLTNSFLLPKPYLKAGLNAKAASEMLYIHRNTFNYRLNEVYRYYNLDIRDYWNAFYFNLYLKNVKQIVDLCTVHNYTHIFLCYY